MEVQAMPYFSIEWNNRVFLSPGDGLGVYIYNDDDLAISTSIGYDGGRDESDDKVNLRGLGDIDGAATANLGIEYDLGFTEPFIDISKHLGGSNGLQIEVGAETMMPLAALLGNQNTTEDRHSPAFVFGVSAEWTDGNYTSEYFGVTSAQSTRSGLDEYDSGSGFKSVDAEIGFLYPITQRWSLLTSVEYSQLVGDAADSPIVKDDGQFSTGAFVTYKF